MSVNKNSFINKGGFVLEQFKILFTDTIHKDLNIEKRIVEDAGGELLFGADKTEEEFFKLVEEADAIVTVYREINEEILLKAKRCKGVVRTGIGFNNIDLAKAGELGKYVCNVPDYCFDEVSDHAIISGLAIGRKLLQWDKRVKSGAWNHDGMQPIYAYQDQTFGLLGFGNIPRYVAKKVKAFGFNVIASDPYVTKEVADEYGVTLVSQDELFAQSDYLSLHAPLTEETKYTVSKESIKKMKDGVIIINTARGPLINEKDLYEALISGKIAGAALDVMEVEPPNMSNPLLKLDNVIITPHAAFYSEKSGIELRRKSFEEAVKIATGLVPKNIVNKRYLVNK